MGERAPVFSARDYMGRPVSLEGFRGKIIVLYFYPRAMTPGCTREAIRFNELLEEFESLGAVIIGVSSDTAERVKRFVEKYGLRFILIPDPEGAIIKAYNVAKKGTKRLSAQRVTFIIDKELIIRRILRNIRPAEKHADLALEAVRELASI